jgi:hypothetical protein
VRARLLGWYWQDVSGPKNASRQKQKTNMLVN